METEMFYVDTSIFRKLDLLLLLDVDERIIINGISLGGMMKAGPGGFPFHDPRGLRNQRKGYPRHHQCQKSGQFHSYTLNLSNINKGMTLSRKSLSSKTYAIRIIPIQYFLQF